MLTTIKKILHVNVLLAFVLVVLTSSVYAKKTKHKSGKKARHLRIVEKEHSDDYLDGIASCYAKKFVGRKTTAGDRFRMDAYTGAHPTLPMGTKLKITNIKNDNVVYITVNDRMGLASGHVIDLPTLPAAKLGLKCPSITKVHLDIIDADAYNSLMQVQLGKALLMANPLLSESDTLNIANKYEEMQKQNASDSK